MISVIRPNTCGTCAFRFRDGNNNLTCRRHAPAAHPVIVMTPKGPQVGGVVSVWPEVNRDWWCGDFAAISAHLDTNNKTIAGLKEAS